MTLSSAANNSVARLDGTLYVNGNLADDNNKSYVLDLNGQTIFTTGSITFSRSCTIKGSGAIISIYDDGHPNQDEIVFQPYIDTSSPDQFVFVMAVLGSTQLWPGNTFYGAVAGNVNIQLQTNSTLTLTTPPVSINFPIATIPSSEMGWVTKTWDTYNQFTINNTVMPPAIKGYPYNTSGVSLCASGGSPYPGMPPYYNWNITFGTLPPGLNLSGNMINGTPDSSAVSGTPYVFTVTATDNSSPQLTASKQFSITVYDNLIPTISSISPDRVQVGSSSVSLTVNGTNFVSGSPGSRIWFGTVEEVSTAYVDSNQLTVTISSSELTTKGSFNITVRNPDGSVSNAKPFIVYESHIATNPPSSTSGSGFTNPNYAYNNDGSQFATSALNDQTQSYGGYGFSIPAGATISMLRVDIKGKCAANDNIKVELSSDGGSTWLGSSSTPTLTTSNADYWVDASAWTTWTPSLINSDKIWAKVTHVKSGGADTVSLDYLPIEITYQTY